MNNFLSRSQIDTVSEGLIAAYRKSCSLKKFTHINIDRFITDFLKLEIRYAAFAEADASKIGFLSDGGTPLKVYENGKAVSRVFPAGTIVIDKFMLRDSEKNRRRFTLAHEAAHFILARMQSPVCRASYHMEFDSERAYSRKELMKLLSSTESQADMLASALLMPRKLVIHKLREYGVTCPVRVYDGALFAVADKPLLHKTAEDLMVSFTALSIRLRELKLIEKHSIIEYIEAELGIGGD